MSLSKNLLKNQATDKSAIFLGLAGVFVAFFSICTPLKFLLLFLNIPIFYSYFTLGSRSGLITTAVLLVPMLIFMPFSAFCDIFLNTIAPAVLVGHFSIQNISQNRKKWWYPESFLLRDVTLLAIFSVIFLSVTFFRESVILDSYTNALKVVSGIEGMENVQVNLSLVLKSIVKFSVGIGIFTKMMLNVMNFKIADALAKRFHKNLRPDFDFSAVRVPTLLALLPLLSLALCLGIDAISFIFGGIFIVSSFAPIICGFSLLHAAANRLQKNWILVLLYLALLCMPIFMLLSIMLLGIIDSFYEIRLIILKNRELDSD